jgi:hypothetical protein
MKKIILLATLFFLTSSFAHAQIGGAAASFAREGFSSRGIGLGNAASAVTTDGEIFTYYNPALAGFATSQNVTATYSALSLDRQLNFLSYVAKVGPTAGLSLALINSGVSQIDGRDIDGNHTQDYSTSENLFMLSFANRFSDELSIGLSLKYYLASLIENVKNSGSLAFDIGAVYQIKLDETGGKTLNVAAAISDIGAKYKWDTSQLYGQQGKATTDNLPLTIRLAAAYEQKNVLGMKSILVAVQYENLSMKDELQQTVFTVENGINTPSVVTQPVTKSETDFKIGVMVQPVQVFKLRFGIDRINFADATFLDSAKPAAGFSIEYPLKGFLAVLDYTYVFEPYAPAGTSIISAGIRF